MLYNWIYTRREEETKTRRDELFYLPAKHLHLFILSKCFIHASKDPQTTLFLHPSAYIPERKEKKGNVHKLARPNRGIGMR